MEEHNISPIFIMGAYRSGTTMLASHLAENAQAVSLPEMPFVLDIIESNASSVDEIKQLYSQISGQFHFKASGLSISENDFINLFEESSTPAQRIYKLLQHHFGFSSTKQKFWIEHTPHNRERVARYLKVFPNAKFIHIVRDPRAVYASMHSYIRWNSQDPIAFAKKWTSSITHGHLAATQYSDIIKEISYEQYVLNQTATLKELCQFSGLSYQPSMNTGNGIKLPEYTLKQHKLVGKAPDASRIKAWQTTISEREAEIIEHECKVWMEYYNISPLSNDTSPATAFEVIIFKMKQRLKIPLSKLKRLKDNLVTKAQ